jgi:hypothetical protein
MMPIFIAIPFDAALMWEGRPPQPCDLCHQRRRLRPGAFDKWDRAAMFVTLVGFSGWFQGFLSGIAQASGLDFLRDADVEERNTRLYEGSRAQLDGKRLAELLQRRSRAGSHI